MLYISKTIPVSHVQRTDENKKQPESAMFLTEICVFSLMMYGREFNPARITVIYIITLINKK